MSGKIILCFAVVLVGQAMSASLFDGEEVKKVAEQFTLSAATVGSHMASLIGFPANPADAQKNIEKIKSVVTNGINDLEDQAGKLREAVRKQASPTLIEKFDEVEKELKKHAAEAKKFLEDKVSKPIDEKYKDDVKKFSESIIKSTKDLEATISKTMDPKKKQ
ncbi:uncharacterized protein LOC112692715 isoform X2 [Sipha flava]|uniref:Uncharacterized protein LOC112692715 isoform X2 n=1 Tax=Sipha flava TaxID=143950 RepID=A0A8B8GLG1_9HEMI|nr:uncharacterized protein LOC112692715 isoform X2 [Sipha flava]